MKRITIYAVLGLVFFLNTASMCSSDDSSSTTNQTNIINTATSGTWRITSYVDSGVVETNNFSGYNFTFSQNGTLTATGNGQTNSGSWSVTDTNSTDDSLDDLDFNIAFSSPDDFFELTDDWDVVSRTDTKIVLIDISGGNGGTDNLIFEKN
jgi:hypothetical protein